VRGIAVVSVVLAAAPAQAQPSPAPVSFAARNRAPVYQLDAAIDTALLLGGLTLWVTPYLVVGNTTAGPSCDPCDAGKLNALDRPFAGSANPTARAVANVWLAVPAIYAIADIGDVGGRHWRSYLSDFVVVAESLAWDGALQEIVRRAVRRPRPYLYAPGLYPDDRSTNEASFSFYSGHTSAAFNIAVSFSYTFMLRHPRSRWNWAVWATTLTVASVEPFLRVTSGDHFPTDVIVGALMGSAMGLLIPALHRIRMPAQLSLVPASGDGRATLSLAGRF
jgi:membrane-associated phospholipid phosphatase